jgi:hypothetical protein
MKSPFFCESRCGLQKVKCQLKPYLLADITVLAVNFEMRIRKGMRIILYLVNTADFVHMMPRNIAIWFTDDLTKSFIVFVFPHLVFT